MFLLKMQRSRIFHISMNWKALNRGEMSHLGVPAPALMLFSLGRGSPERKAPPLSCQPALLTSFSGFFYAYTYKVFDICEN